MAQLDPSSVAKKWSQRLQGAAQQITDSVRGVTVSPTSQAAKKQDTMKARLVQAIDNGKWAAGLNSVSLGDWQNAMISKGVPRIQQGAIESEGKVETFMGQFLPFAARVSGEVRAMPNTTDQDRKNRMLANFDKMKTFRRSGR